MVFDPKDDFPKAVTIDEYINLLLENDGELLKDYNFVVNESWGKEWDGVRELQQKISSEEADRVSRKATRGRSPSLFSEKADTLGVPTQEKEQEIKEDKTIDEGTKFKPKS